MNEIKLVNQFLLNQYINKKNSGYFNGAVIYLDIAGFTKLTCSLMKTKSYGSEIVHEIITKYFGYSTNQIYESGGFITNYEGDGFVGIIPSKGDDKKNTIHSAIQLSNRIINFFNHNSEIKTKLGSYQLSVRIVISFGRIYWGISENIEQNIGYFYGSVISNLKKGKQYCNKQSLLIDNKCLQNVIEFSETKQINEKWSNIQIKSEQKSEVKIIDYQKFSSEIIDKFLNKKIKRIGYIGEFRELITCFVKINKTELKLSLSQIIYKIYLYNGYLKDIEITERHGLILIYFGAPESLEKMFYLAIKFCLDLRKLFWEKISFSMTSDTSFTGFINTKFCKEFVAIGKAINLSARMINVSKKNQILLDRKISKYVKNQFIIKKHSTINFKGYDEPVELFNLLDNLPQKATTYQNIIGRKDELNEINKFFTKFYDKRRMSLVKIFGEAGIGKTYFIKHYKNISKIKTIWFDFNCDFIVQKSFNSLTKFFLGFFEQDPQNSIKQRNIKFDSIYDDFLKNTVQKKYLEELSTLKPVFANIIHLKENQQFQQLNPNIKYYKIMRSISLFFMQFSLEKPVVLFIDDSQYLDQSTLEWLHFFSKEASSCPIMIILCQRNFSENSFPNLSISSENQSEILLKPLSEEISQKFIHDLLGKSVYENELTKFILDNSNGNPFFIEQIIKYFLEQTDLKNSVNISLNVSIPTSIKLIIMARIDRLSKKSIQVVKIASVIGNTFSIKLLNDVIKNEFIELNLISALENDIIVKLDDENYAFKHALIRESIYKMQLTIQIKAIHLSIAKSYEKLYSKNIELFAEECGYHFERAELFEKAGDYFFKVVTKNRNNFLNQSAIDSCLKILTFKNKIKRKLLLDVIYNCANLYIEIGKWGKGYHLLLKQIAIAKKDNNIEKIGEALSSLGWIKYVKGDFHNAIKFYDQALDISIRHNFAKLNSIVSGNKSVVFFRTNEFQKAEELLKIKIEKDLKHNFENGLLTAYCHLATMHLVKTEYEKAKEFFFLTLEIAKKNQKNNFLSAVYGSLGIIFKNEKNYSKSLEYYLNDIKFCQEGGNLHKLSVNYGNIAQVYLIQNNFSEAEKYTQKKLEISKELGYVKGMIRSYVTFCDIETKKLNILSALDLLYKAKDIVNSDINEHIFILFKIAYLLEYQEKNRESIAIYNKILKLSQKINNSYYIADCYFNMANAESKIGISSKAEEHFRIALEISKKNKFFNILRLALTSYLRFLFIQRKIETIENLIIDFNLKKEINNSQFDIEIEFAKLCLKYYKNFNSNDRNKILSEILDIIKKSSEKFKQIDRLYFLIECNILTKSYPNYFEEIAKLKKTILHIKEKDLELAEISQYRKINNYLNKL
ncbi:MAG: AAA family ATPase [Candidatus Cloacimonetes bacterium]|nr:AAA family ATPase [Candidatus Cloacimonadota bacterium]